MNADKLADALRELTEACEAEYCSPDTNGEGDDEKVAFPEEACNITFGMIRKARAALAAHDAQPAQAAQPVDWPKGRVNVPYPLPFDPEARLVGFVIKSGHPWYGTGLSSPLFALDNACNASAPSAPLVGVPDGFWLAPIIVTPEMEDAADRRDDEEPLTDWGKMRNASRQAVWDAMRLAAPQPPAQQSDQFKITGDNATKECASMSDAVQMAEAFIWQDDEGCCWIPSRCWQSAVSEIQRLETVLYPIGGQPAQPSADAEDAARIDWLNDRMMVASCDVWEKLGIDGIDLRAAIDAARAAEGGSNGLAKARAARPLEFRVGRQP